MGGTRNPNINANLMQSNGGVNLGNQGKLDLGREGSPKFDLQRNEGGFRAKNSGYMDAAREQSSSSRNDVNGMFGGAKWTQTPDGRWSLDMTMSPELQAATQNAMGRIQNTPDAGAARDAALEAAYQMQASRLDPQYAQRQSALETQLANEGYSRGDAGWNQAMGDFGRDRNDAYQQALLSAQSGAGNTAYAQTLAAAMQPYQQLQMLRGLGEGTGLAALGQAQPTQSLTAYSAQKQAELQQQAQDNAEKNSMMGGVVGLGTIPLIAAGGI